MDDNREVKTWLDSFYGDQFLVVVSSFGTVWTWLFSTPCCYYTSPFRNLHSCCDIYVCLCMFYNYWCEVSIISWHPERHMCLSWLLFFILLLIIIILLYVKVHIVIMRSWLNTRNGYHVCMLLGVCFWDECMSRFCCCVLRCVCFMFSHRIICYAANVGCSAIFVFFLRNLHSILFADHISNA